MTTGNDSVDGPDLPLSDTDDRPEILHEMGNMFLVRVDGEVDQVPNTAKNELLYKHGLHTLLHADAEQGPTVLTGEDEDVYAAVAPTDNDSVYTIWYGDDESYPVQNPPSKANEVLRGVRDALETPPDYSTLEEVYTWILNNQVRRDVIEKLIALFPSSSVIPGDEGWVIEGLFLLTWDARVFLVGDNLEEGSYRVAGGVQETDEKREFLSLVPSDGELVDEDEDNEVRIGTETYELTERELEFLAKAQWLLHYDEMYEDDALWSVIERYVTRAPTQ